MGQPEVVVPTGCLASPNAQLGELLIEVYVKRCTVSPWLRRASDSISA